MHVLFDTLQLFGDERLYLTNKSIDASSSFEPQQTHMVPMPEIIKFASEFKPAVSHLRQRK